MTSFNLSSVHFPLSWGHWPPGTSFGGEPTVFLGEYDSLFGGCFSSFGLIPKIGIWEEVLLPHQEKGVFQAGQSQPGIELG